MPNNEKELNCYLLDQLELIERLEIVAKNGDNDEVLKQLMLEKKFVERKLYQKPPLANEQPWNQSPAAGTAPGSLSTDRNNRKTRIAIRAVIRLILQSCI